MRRPPDRPPPPGHGAVRLRLTGLLAWGHVVPRPGEVVRMTTPEGAARTAIVTVDDDPGVSRAVARDLRRRYGEQHRIVRAESGDAGAGRAAGDEAARRPGRGDPGRLPDAADERHRVPRAGDGPVPGGAPGAAHRLRRHRRRHRRDQRRRPRPLPAQAVGPAGGEALPGGRRAAGARGGRRIGGRCPRPRWSGTAGRRARPRSASSSPATRCLPLVRLRRAGGPAAAGGGRGRRAQRCRW